MAHLLAVVALPALCLYFNSSCNALVHLAAELGLWCARLCSGSPSSLLVPSILTALPAHPWPLEPISAAGWFPTHWSMLSNSSACLIFFFVQKFYVYWCARVEPSHRVVCYKPPLCHNKNEIILMGSAKHPAQAQLHGRESQSKSMCGQRACAGCGRTCLRSRRR